MWWTVPLRRRVTNLAQSIAWFAPDISLPCKSRCSAGGISPSVTTNIAPPAVTIVNEAMAREQWPGEDPVGRQVILREPGQEPVRMTIVGVVEERDSVRLDAPLPTSHEMYMPYLQRPNAFGLTALTFVVRTTVVPEALAKSCETAVRAIDRNIPISQVQSMQRVIADKLWRSRVSAMLLAVFAAIALALAAVGIYGVISYGVRDRTREIGIRVALGGTQLDILRLVMLQSLKPVAAGLVLGLGVAMAASRLVTALLYRVTATDMVQLTPAWSPLLDGHRHPGHFGARLARH